MTEFQPFVMERMMSKWENLVDVNLSESGVHPMTLGELLEMGGLDVGAVSDVLINYPQANGTIELRETIAAMYPGATSENVLVTVGAAEANFLALTTLLEPGDEAVIMLPNYMQVWGVAKNRGLVVRECHLSEERGWAPDPAELEAAATSKTKLIAVCNPNNPTGRIMTTAEMDAVVRVAERTGAWLLADEVYRGAERETDEETPSFYGRYDRVLAQGSTSKAYGLPGLRLGWSVGPAQTLDDMWARHEYTTIAATALSNRLATLALSEKVRPRILARTRRFIREGFPVLEEWMRGHGDTFQLVAPQAAAIAFVRYRIDINSTELVQRLFDEKSVLIVPGDHFGLDGHLRISFGLPPEYLRDGLGRIHTMLVELDKAEARA
jgi:aspartate/methionine/tyrosine aminotransferase